MIDMVEAMARRVVFAISDLESKVINSLKWSVADAQDDPAEDTALRCFIGVGSSSCFLLA